MTRENPCKLTLEEIDIGIEYFQRDPLGFGLDEFVKRCQNGRFVAVDENGNGIPMPEWAKNGERMPKTATTAAKEAEA